VKFGKWLGGGLGWAMGGPIGGILGFALGSLFDTANITTLSAEQIDNPSTTNYKRPTTRPADFQISLLVLMAAVIKADGKILKTEINFIRDFLIKQFGREQAGQMMIMLREIVKQNIDVYEVSQQIKQQMDHPSRLQLLHFLFALCLADDELNPVEEELVSRIAIFLGISQKDIASIKAMFSIKKTTTQYYAILEIESTVTDEEIKKAYRKMAVKYHPDKVSHLGETAQKAATEKFKQVQEAYEQIKKERGL